MHIAKLNFHGNPNIGLYGLATDNFCLMGRGLSKKTIEIIKKVLNVPVFQINLYGTELVGIFAIANSKAVLLPDIIKKLELRELKKELKKLEIKVQTIKTEYTSFGNNVLLNDKAGIISSVYPKAITDKIAKLFEVKVRQMDLAGLHIPGSLGAITNKGGLFGINLSEKDIDKVEDLFGFEIGLGTVNMGNPLVRSGIIANSNGLIMGGMSSGYEIIRMDESLGFLK